MENRSRMMSFIQIRANEKKGKDVKDIDNEDVGGEQLNLDDKSMRLKRNHPHEEEYVVLKRRGLLFTTKEDSNGMFSCFCGKKRTPQDVQLVNRRLTVRKGDKIEAQLNFNTMRIQLEDNDKTFNLRVHASSPANVKHFYFEPTSQQNANLWKQDILKAIEGSKGKQYPLSYLTSLNEYWKTGSITEDEFSRTCDSGDILLFKSQHGAAKFQRTLTSSEYDHIGVVLRNQKDQVLIFQSNSNTGVAYTFWKDLNRFRWYQSVEKIVYRRLNLQRTEELLQSIQSFFVENLDKAFGLGFGKLIKFHSSMQKTEQQKKNRTYFCSELVAALYKGMGLLEKDKSCTQYYPVHFSGSHSLPLLKGSLGPEQIVCFDVEAIRDKYK